MKPTEFSQFTGCFFVLKLLPSGVQCTRCFQTKANQGAESVPGFHGVLSY